MRGGVILLSALIAIAGLCAWNYFTEESVAPAAASPEAGETMEDEADSSLRATAPARSHSPETGTGEKPASRPARGGEEAAPSAPQSAPHVEFEVENLAWENRLDEVMRASAVSESAKAQKILEMLPTLPAEALQRGTEIAIRLLRDRDYSAARDRLLDPQTHGMVASALFADLLERRDEIALPALLAIARIPSHPYAAAARDNLELLLGKRIDPQSGAVEMEIRHALAAH
jgi:hypothetical protein